MDPIPTAPFSSKKASTCCLSSSVIRVDSSTSCRNAWPGAGGAGAGAADTGAGAVETGTEEDTSAAAAGVGAVASTGAGADTGAGVGTRGTVGGSVVVDEAAAA